MLLGLQELSSLAINLLISFMIYLLIVSKHFPETQTDIFKQSTPSQNSSFSVIKDKEKSSRSSHLTSWNRQMFDCQRLIAFRMTDHGCSGINNISYTWLAMEKMTWKPEEILGNIQVKCMLFWHSLKGLYVTICRSLNASVASFIGHMWSDC